LTLIVASSYANAAIIAADMRLSWNGRIEEDLSLKCGVLDFYDGRLIYAYTGIARYEAFGTREWLREVTAKHLQAWMTANEWLLKLKEIAISDFNTHPALKAAPTKDKRLTMVFCGQAVQIEGGPRRPVAAILSNFENYVAGIRHSEAQSEFWLWCWPTVFGPDAWTSCFGYSDVVPADDKAELEALVRGNHPPDAVLGKSEAIIVRASISPLSNGTVGPNITKAILPSDPARWPSVGLSSDQPGDRVFFLDHFSAPMSLGIYDAKLSAPGIVQPRPVVRRQSKRKTSK
jgi:hypothetical protein